MSDFHPRDYQSEAVQFLLDRPAAALFADPGLGKTGAVLEYLDRLQARERRRLRALVVAPLRVVYSVWPDEIQKWDQFRYFDVSIAHGKGKESAPESRAEIHLLNCENIFWFLDGGHFEGFDVLVIDESSKFKNPSSKRFKRLRKYIDRFPRRVLLTGTPSPKSIGDLYSQIYLLDNGAALGNTLTKFRSRYMRPVRFPDFVTWEPRPEADAEVGEAIKHLVFRLDQADHLKLPPLVENVVRVDIPAGARKKYDEVERDLFTEIGDSEILVPSAAVSYGVCRQIASGRVYVEGRESAPVKKRFKIVHSAKVDTLVDVVDELQGKPVLIAYHFRHSLDVLREKYPRAPWIGSGVSAAKSRRIVSEWNRGEIPVLFGHPASMGHGLNLQAGGNDLIWFDLPDDLELFIQTNRRLYRQGTTKQVRIHYLIARGTVDIAIRARLRRKASSQMDLLNLLKNYRMKKRNLLPRPKPKV